MLALFIEFHSALYLQPILRLLSEPFNPANDVGK